MGACSAQKYPAAEGFGFPTFRVKGLGLNSYFYFLSFGRRGCFKFELGGGEDYLYTFGQAYWCMSKQTLSTP